MKRRWTGSKVLRKLGLAWAFSGWLACALEPPPDVSPVETRTAALSSESTAFLKYDITAHPGTPNPTDVDGDLRQAGNQYWALEAIGTPAAQAVGSGSTLAWEVQTLGSGREERWRLPVSSANATLARNQGWNLRTRLRQPSASDTTGPGVYVTYRDGTKMWQLFFGTDASGNPIVQPYGHMGSATATGSGFHLYELTYDPAVSTATLKIDGQVALSGIAGVGSSSDQDVFFGDGAQYDDGHAQFQMVEWRVHHVDAAPTGTARVRYEITSDTATHDPTIVDGYVTQSGTQLWDLDNLGTPAASAVVDGSTVVWNVNTLAGTPGREERWWMPVLAADATTGAQQGWQLKARLRLPQSGDTVGWGAAFELFDGQKLWAMQWGTNSTGLPIVGFYGEPDTVQLSQGGFHTYQLVYDPVTSTATLFVDGVSRLSDIVGVNYVVSPQIFWGDLAQNDDSHAQYQLIEWATH